MVAGVFSKMLIYEYHCSPPTTQDRAVFPLAVPFVVKDCNKFSCRESGRGALEAYCAEGGMPANTVLWLQRAGRAGDASESLGGLGASTLRRKAERLFGAVMQAEVLFLNCLDALG